MCSFYHRHRCARILLRATVVVLVLSCIGLACAFQSMDDVRGFVLRDAAENGNLARVKWLLKGHPDLVDNKSNRKWTALYWAVVSDHTDVAVYLLANKADVNAKTDNGDSLLHMAAYLGNEKMAVLLLAHGADVSAEDNHGGTPLNAAKSNVVELLLAHGANIEIGRASC